MNEFSSKVESRPSQAEILVDLKKERRPYEANQRHKHYVGLPVCWPGTIYGVWESSPKGRWTIRPEASSGGSHNGVTIDVKIKDYPKLRAVERGHRAWVEGLIGDISHGEVYLDDGARLTLK